MTIRVLRVIEYEYPDYKAYEHDREQWTEKTPPTARNMRMWSSVVRVTHQDHEGCPTDMPVDPWAAPATTNDNNKENTTT